MQRIAAVVPPRLGAAADVSTVSRALDDLARQSNQLADSVAVQFVDVDLVVGENVVYHSLGRQPRMVLVAPHEAVPGFGVGWDPTQTGTTRAVIITVVGSAARCRVRIE